MRCRRFSLFALAAFLFLLIPPVQAQVAPVAVWMAVGGDNLTRLLWNNSAGSISLWCINADGTVATYVYGPYSGFK